MAHFRKKTGILLINLGTPDAPKPAAVRRYLREFLSDPFVIDIPAIFRWILLNAIILPFRVKQSTHAYRQIWTDQGSPLLVNSKALSSKLQKTLNENYVVELAMRYGQPTLDSAIKKLLSHSIDSILVVPLYPQYAQSTTESSLAAAKKQIRTFNKLIAIQTINNFYANPYYINSKSTLIKKSLADKQIDKLIFSYHGLPERHVRKVCPGTICHQGCSEISSANQHCYRAQCYTTSHLIAKALNLTADQYLVSFQSRLGKEPWIQPYTDHMLNQLASEGIKNIAVACPSFLVDCLETLEEINLRARSQWCAHGGNEFIFIPCLNVEPYWVDAFSRLITNAILPTTTLKRTSL